jgi:hypothetical protein
LIQPPVLMLVGKHPSTSIATAQSQSPINRSDFPF